MIGRARLESWIHSAPIPAPFPTLFLGLVRQDKCIFIPLLILLVKPDCWSRQNISGTQCDFNMSSYYCSLHCSHHFDNQRCDLSHYKSLYKIGLGINSEEFKPKDFLFVAKETIKRLTRINELPFGVYEYLKFHDLRDVTRLVARDGSIKPYAVHQMDIYRDMTWYNLKIAELINLGKLVLDFAKTPEEAIAFLYFWEEHSAIAVRYFGKLKYANDYKTTYGSDAIEIVKFWHAQQKEGCDADFPAAIDSPRDKSPEEIYHQRVQELAREYNRHYYNALLTYVEDEKTKAEADPGVPFLHPLASLPSYLKRIKKYDLLEEGVITSRGVLTKNAIIDMDKKHKTVKNMLVVQAVVDARFHFDNGCYGRELFSASLYKLTECPFEII